MKTNEKLVVYQLHALMMMGNKLMNDEMKQQLLDTYFVIEQNLNLSSKPIKFLLTEFGENMDIMLEQRQAQVNKQMRIHGSAVGGRRRGGGGVQSKSPVRSNVLNRSLDDNHKTLVTKAGRRVASPEVIKMHEDIFDGSMAIMVSETLSKQ